MIAFLDNLTGINAVFAICAVIGGVFFIFRMILLFSGIGADAGGDVGDIGDLGDIGDIGNINDIEGDIGDVGDMGDMNGHADFDAHGDTDMSFKLVSLQGLTAFFMMFGVAGLVASLDFGWNEYRSIAFAVAVGGLMIWLLKMLFKGATKLQSSGNIHLKNAIGQTGTVYLTIKPDEPGKVRVAVQNHLKVFNAMSKDETEIKSDEAIRVVGVVANNILLVEKIKE